GHTQAEAIGRQLEDLVATPDIREEIRTNLRQARTGERLRTTPRRARKRGTLGDVEISATPLIVDGAEVGFIATYHDITELLRARREAETANQTKTAFLPPTEQRSRP